MSVAVNFKPWRSLISGRALASCRACVVVPARNERASLPATLDALAAQVDCAGRRLPPECFEIVLLLNNCTDDSLQISKRWKREHRDIQLHIVKRSISANRAHVGTARRWLMDTAWRRMKEVGPGGLAILSTDADTAVAPDWIAQNLRSIELGAQAVGGVIGWKSGHFERLPIGVQRAVRADREYQSLQARLEHLLDPQEGDLWPRHLEHFGASLACTPRAYARAGGLPAVKHLEDVAFVSALERCGVTIRHDPKVMVHTSARLRGRSLVGLSGQLRRWQRMSDKGEEQLVPSTAWLAYRFTMLHTLRLFHARSRSTTLKDFPESWQAHLLKERAKHRLEPHFLAAIDCERLMWESFRGKRAQRIQLANVTLRKMIRELNGLSTPSAGPKPYVSETTPSARELLATNELYSMPVMLAMPCAARD
jgi:hypothetical protein